MPVFRPQNRLKTGLKIKPVPPSRRPSLQMYCSTAGCLTLWGRDLWLEPVQPGEAGQDGCFHEGGLVVKQGSHLRENCVFYAKKSRLRKSENACVYCTVTSHQNAFSLFVFCTHQRFVQHLAVGLNILDFHRPLPPPFPIPSW